MSHICYFKLDFKGKKRDSDTEKSLRESSQGLATVDFISVWLGSAAEELDPPGRTQDDGAVSWSSPGARLGGGAGLAPGAGTCVSRRSAAADTESCLMSRPSGTEKRLKILHSSS